MPTRFLWRLIKRSEVRHEELILRTGRSRATTPGQLRLKIISVVLWKDADPDIPILKEAKAEYAKLQRSMRGRV